MYKYSKVLHIGAPLVETIFNEEVEITEKVDGCFEYTTRIMTDQGNIPIGKIVNQKLDVMVLSYNTDMKQAEYKRILNYHMEKSRGFIQFRVKSRKKSKQSKVIVCTPDHQIYSNGEWVDAETLQPGDIVSHYSDTLSAEAKQMILGMLIGDGHIGKVSDDTRRIQWGQSVKHSDYADMVAEFHVMHEISQQKSGWGGMIRRFNSPANMNIGDLIRNYCEVNGKKIITYKWADALNPIGIAFWYMDDGSCSFGDLQRPRAVFHTNAYTFEEVTLLSDMLKRKFGIDSKVFDSKGWSIALTADGTEILFSLIYPYISKDMKYKVSEKYRDADTCLPPNIFNDIPSITDTVVIDIVKPIDLSTKKGRQNKQYDLTIEDNHNYFANAILVHNSQCRVHLTEDFVMVGSKNQSSADQGMFSLAHDCGAIIHSETDWRQFGDDVTLFCEFLKSPKHNTISYGRVPLNNLYLFGALVDGVHMQTDDLFEIAKVIEIDPPNIMYVGKVESAEELKAFMTHQSYLEGSVVEGVVIKNYHRTYDPLQVHSQAFIGYPMCAKYVREDFKRDNAKQWNTIDRKKGVDAIVEMFFTGERFLKTVQHLKDEGKIDYQKSDLKYLIPEFFGDLMDEKKEEMTRMIMAEVFKTVKKRSNGYVVKSWVDHLTERQFDKGDE